MKPKIVILDGYTLNPGDLSWDGLRALGDVTVHERTPPDLVLERARGAQVLFTNKTVLSADTIARLPELRYVGVLATGFNVVDVEAARGRGIPVTNVPNYGSKAVAQATFALLLELTNNVGEHARAVKSGAWSKNPDFCFWTRPLIELDGQTMGIVGYGRIGSAVGDIARAFGMRVLANSVELPDSTPLEKLLAESDVVTLHCPLTPETDKLINAERLARMKRTAFLLNASRGPLVDEPALARALNDERIAGAGLDVLAVEPPRPDNPLLTAKNCVITPHIAWATRAARSRLLNIAVENLRSFLAGQTKNAVNG